MAKCEQCSKDYESKRSTSKYCSSLCRKLAFHNKDAKPRNAKDENANSGTLRQPSELEVVEDFATAGTMTPEGLKLEVPANYGTPDCACKHCQTERSKAGGRRLINHGAYKDRNQLADKEVNRVSLPGDVDYDGVCNEPKYDSHRIATRAT